MFQFVKCVLDDETGASTAEYAVLLATVGTAVAAGLATFDSGLTGMFTTLTGKMLAWVS
jgi:Flp pilus assembly pilin Flp